MDALRPYRTALTCMLMAATLLFSGIAWADNNYGAGTYGACQYGSCSLTLSSSGSVSLDIVPTASGVCTVQSDSVSVLTDNSNGYSLTIGGAAASSALTNGTSTIAAAPGTFAVPQVLGNNTWGYRVDSTGNFGAGPTTSQSNSSPSALTFAALPTSSQSADTLANTTSPADPAAITTVWYGVCANLATVAGTYTAQVTYTATTN